MKKIRWMLCISLLTTVMTFAGENKPTIQWSGKGDAYTRKDTGIYVWWVPGILLEKGDYRVTVRVRSDVAQAFTLMAVDAVIGQIKWRASAKTEEEYHSHELGTFHYDGTYLLRFSDWNVPGFYIESIFLTLIGEEEKPVGPRISADKKDGWFALQHTQFIVDKEMKKEGTGSVRVTLQTAPNAQWYDIGIMTRITKDEATSVSFWLNFPEKMQQLWVRMISGEGEGCIRLNPDVLGMKPGKWKLVELPVSLFHFQKDKSKLKDVKGIAISADCKSTPLTFLVDDLLLE